MPLPAAHSRRLVEYDAMRRRLWILGQRCHHGAAGVLVATVACLGLVTDPVTATRTPSMLALAAGGLLMLHDRKDLPIWFERGHGSQP
ncbi:MAG TPA: hypothetical protein VE992_06000 [Solirubrobacteraceae bacterium]|nr:hypothetical protein [Solirubrobacteraceae bacterium]